ncbi:MAG: methylmalonyl-CoA mutase family protein, partial [Chitinophagaceae bacterium]|nr:methylmalonyl-CoA mutase family protein [Chitinophagaceae bacterium]
LGGTQSLHTNGYDEALGLPTEEAARIALRTQQIIAHESGAPDTADPLAGSYYVEYLTDETERRAVELMDRIEAMGGAVSAVEQGFIQEQIASSAYRYQQEVERGERIIVGVNQFLSAEHSAIPVMRIDDGVRQVQTGQLQAIRDGRDAVAVEAALQSIRNAATGTENLMPHVLHAVERSCTLGEISDVLREVFGEFRG